MTSSHSVGTPRNTFSKVDPVMMQVVKNGLDSIAEQMAITLQYTAHSPVIREVLDFATALMDAEGRLISQTSGAPIFVNAMGPTLRFVIEQSIPLEEWEEGDVFLVNDPYLGGSQHLPDIVMFRPIFRDGILAGVCGCVAHHVDVGGTSPGSYTMTADSIFQEGLRIPPVKLFSRGQLVEDIKNLFLANIRLPDFVWGDIEAQLACMRIGERSFHELLDRYGTKTISECVDELMNYSERLVRRGIGSIPNGRYEYEDWLDDDGVNDKPAVIRLALIINEDSVIADFTGSDLQRDAPINCSKSMTGAVVHYCLAAIIGSDIPVNEGAFRPVTFIMPKASIVAAAPPAPVVGRMAIVHRTCDTVLGAMAQALPNKIPAAYYGMSTTYHLSGVGPDNTTTWALFEIEIGGWGGSSKRDGLETCSAHIHNPANTQVEMVERLHPIRIERYELIPDSGGPGKHRGGLGLRRDLRILKGSARLTILADRMKYAPYGLNGGGKGSYTEIIINPGTSRERKLPSKVTGVSIKSGDIVSFRTSGGGGWGSPLDRDRKAVERDLYLGKISREVAKNVYGL